MGVALAPRARFEPLPGRRSRPVSRRTGPAATAPSGARDRRGAGRADGPRVLSSERDTERHAQKRDRILSGGACASGRAGAASSGDRRCREDKHQTRAHRPECATSRQHTSFLPTSTDRRVRAPRRAQLAVGARGHPLSAVVCGTARRGPDHAPRARPSGVMSASIASAEPRACLASDAAGSRAQGSAAVRGRVSAHRWPRESASSSRASRVVL